jgi:hypothetical protein
MSFMTSGSFGRQKRRKKNSPECVWKKNILVVEQLVQTFGVTLPDWLRICPYYDEARRRIPQSPIDPVNPHD